MYVNINKGDVTIMSYHDVTEIYVSETKTIVITYLLNHREIHSCQFIDDEWDDIDVIKK